MAPSSARCSPRIGALHALLSRLRLRPRRAGFLKKRTFRPRLEALEDRTLLNSGSITSQITIVNNSGFTLTFSSENFDNGTHDLTTRPNTIPNGATAVWKVGDGSGFLGAPVGVVGSTTWDVGNTGIQDQFNLDFPLVGVNHASQSLSYNSTNYFNATQFWSGNDPTFTLGINQPSANLGVWGTVTPTVPGSDGAMNMLLLPDGTVMIHGAGNGSTNGASPNWYLLSPNSTPGSLTNGSYAVTNNSITTLAAMTTGRRFFPAEVLPNDTVFVYGGEFTNTSPVGSQPEVNSGEYFTLGQSSTTPWGTLPTLPTTAGFLTSGQFGDQATELLANDQILATDPQGQNSFVFNVPSSVPTNQNDASGTWTAVANTAATQSLSANGDNEDNWVLLPGGDVLDYQVKVSDANPAGGGSAQLYVPKGNTIPANDVSPGGSATSVGQWVNASTGLIQLTATVAGNGDLGPGVLLPFYAPFNGPAVMYFGATGSTAFYNPANNTWTSSTTNAFDAEPTYNIPGGANNVQMVSEDGPAAVLPNGEVLVALSQQGTGGNYPGPTRIYLFDPTLTNGATASAFTDVTAPDSTLNSTANPANSPGNAYHESMLVLPTAQILMSDSATNTLWLYTPTGTTATPLPGTGPTITSITINPATGLPQIIGTKLNGPTEGAYYGDDAKMASNYPLVRLTDANGNVTYATASNWQTGIVGGGDPSVDFSLPAGKSLSDYATVTVVADGFSSAPVQALTSPNVIAPSDQSSVEGASQVFNLGSFIDPIGSPWTVDVNWGDGTPDSTFTVSTAGSLGTLSHTYGEEGTYKPTVTVTDTTNNLSGSASFNVAVSDPAVVASGVAVSAVEGAAFTGTPVATFTDPGGAEPNSSDSSGTINDHYKVVSIDWGDGTPLDTSSGAISLLGNTFTVSGNHTYGEEGSYTITAIIDHEGVDTTVQTTATVSDPAVVASGVAVSAVEGAAFTGTPVATFTDPGGAEPNPSDPSGSINDHYKVVSVDWGDGTALDTSSGAISLLRNTFIVSGNHTYGEEGSYTITAIIDHEGVDTTVKTTATVSDPAVIATSTPVYGVECRTLTVQVATFTDPGGAEPNPSDPSGTLNNHYKVDSINWGDGTPLDTTTGTIAFSGSPGSMTDPFTVTGSHAFQHEGTYTVTTTLDHEGILTITQTTAIIKDDIGLLLLDPSGSQSLMVNGNGVVDVTGCGAAVVNSTSASAAFFAGNASVTAEDFDVTGGVQSSTKGSLPPVDHEAATPDPLGLALPTPPSATFAAVNYSASAPLTLHPGTYLGGIALSGQASVTLLPGVYYMQGGGFTVSGQVTVSGSNVLIVNAPSSSLNTISVSGQAHVNLSGLTSGPYQGIVMMQDPASSNPVSFTGQSAVVTLTGVVYVPAAPVQISGNAIVTIDPGAGTATLPPYLGALIARDLKVGTNGQLIINPDPPGSADAAVVHAGLSSSSVGGSIAASAAIAKSPSISTAGNAVLPYLLNGNLQVLGSNPSSVAEPPTAANTSTATQPITSQLLASSASLGVRSQRSMTTLSDSWNEQLVDELFSRLSTES